MTALRPVLAEVRALVEVLEAEGWETPEQVAEACILALDKARADRTLHVAVMQFGEAQPFYLGLGPFPGVKSARKAVTSYPGATEAYKIVVVPMLNEAGIDAMLKDVG